MSMTLNITPKDMRKKLAAIDALFNELSNDKKLPTFVDFFIESIALGTSENLNLKKLFPRHHKKVTKWLSAHSSNAVEIGKLGK